MKGKRARVAKGDDLRQRLGNLGNGRDEMNLCELPFATLSERNDGRTILRFEIEDFDSDLNQIVTRRLTVKGDAEHGLPTEKDEEIYLGLLKYSSDYNGFASPEIRLSRTDLFHLMGWRKSDWAYARLHLGLQRLVGVRLSYENLWRDNNEKQWRDQGAFGILESFEFRDSRIPGKGGYEEFSSVFRWSNVMFESFDSNYLKRIDYGLARGLSATARRLYRYLDKHFHPPHRTKFAIDLARLAYQHIGLSTGVELDKVRKRHIGPAAEELEAAGYLRAAAAEERFQRARRGVWSAVFEQAASGKVDSTLTAESKSPLIAAMGKRGISQAAAQRLTKQVSKETLVRALKAMDEQRGRGTVIHAPDRWLAKAVQDGFQPTAEIIKAALRPERQIFRSSRKAS